MRSKPPLGTVSINDAASRIGCGYETVRIYVRTGLLTAVRPLGKGPGKPTFIPADEVEAFVQGQAEAVRELRRSKSKRGRKAVAP